MNDHRCRAIGSGVGDPASAIDPGSTAPAGFFPHHVKEC
jgi:hypothetical protein